MVPTLQTIMNSFYYFDYRENIHLSVELTHWQSDWCSILFYLRCIYTFRSIYLFHVILSLCLSSRPFTGPQHIHIYIYIYIHTHTQNVFIYIGEIYIFIYIQQLCEDTGCSPEDLPEAMNDREKWRERVRDIRASGTTWWWGWYIFIIKSFQTIVLIFIVISTAFWSISTSRWLST